MAGATATLSPGATVSADNWGWRHAGRRAWAVRHLTFRIDPGERVLLLGPSGAGKSTVLSALAGILGTADEGEEEGTLTVSGTRTSALTGHAALMMQDPESQIVMARVGDDVAFGCENMGVPPAEIWPRVRDALVGVGLFGVPLDHPTNHLSGGEQQRLVLAGALAMGAGLLLLDEPTANLDWPGVSQVRDTVEQLVADRSHTLVVVEHHCEVWAPLVDRVIVLAGNQIVADDSPDQVFSTLGPDLAAMGVWVPGHHTQRRVTRFVPDPRTTRQESSVHDSTTIHPSQHSPVEHLASTSIECPTALQTAKPASGRGRDSKEHGTCEDPSTTLTPIITTHDLSIGYQETTIRTSLNFSIPAAMSTVITGPNGSGKTTLALTLAGLLAPLSGTVDVAEALSPAGRPHPHTWTSKELVPRIATVFQSPDHQFVTSTVFDEVAVGLRITKHPSEVVNQEVTRVLDLLHLDHLAKAHPLTLSGGEKRRLSVATALVSNPKVIILDEPTFGQDLLTWTSLVDLIRLLADQGTTIISVTHDQEYAHALGDHHIDMAALT
ncbi:MAG: energy-coupling factor ABC transporter ATP-binding protein [Propionibacteriaceae bacterium]|nr:energy-coupling factor ABC transporter ATP-binding protein [Propionibacteriaceae bacterium]